MEEKNMILGDLHSGVSDGSIVMMNHQLNYLDGVVDYAIDNGIKTIFQTGDTMDSRSSMNTLVFSEWKTRFFDRLRDNNILFVMLVGNHDMFYKQTIHPNSPTEFLSEYHNVIIVDRPMIWEPLNMLMVPWICKENRDEIIPLLETTDAKMVMGHFEIKGARMESGICDSGIPMSEFERFGMVFSGHFHIKERYGNIEYVGTPYQMNWGDLKATEKGFHIFNDFGMEFIENTTDIFLQINYTDKFDYEMYLRQHELENKFVKVIVVDREDTARFERFMMELEDSKCAKLVVQEPFENRDHENSSIDTTGDITETESTSDLLKDYIVEVYPERKEPVDKLMQRILSQAQQEELC